jgi:hypothetical protein
MKPDAQLDRHGDGRTLGGARGDVSWCRDPSRRPYFPSTRWHPDRRTHASGTTTCRVVHDLAGLADPAKRRSDLTHGRRRARPKIGTSAAAISSSPAWRSPAELWTLPVDRWLARQVTAHDHDDQPDHSPGAHRSICTGARTTSPCRAMSLQWGDWRPPVLRGRRAGADVRPRARSETRPGAPDARDRAGCSPSV